MSKTKIIYLFIFIFSSCTSIEKYNQQISKVHNPTELYEDVDYAYNKITKLHPDLYWYISKDSLNKEFNSLKESIQSPMSSLDFYKELAPVVSSIRQGHLSINPPKKKQTKKDIKENGKIVNPFKAFGFNNINNKLIIRKNYGKDSSIIEGSEVISVDNKSVDSLLASFQNLYTGDGYNETFIPRYTMTSFGNMYLNTHNPKDSIQISLSKNDSIYSHYLFSHEKKEPTVKDSTSAKDAVPEKTKAEKKIAKQNKKQKRIWEKKHAYNKYKKEKNRHFEFLKSDSINSISYMKILGFKGGKYKDFYEECFSKIDSANSEYLIIDLRDNLGGALSEIHELYSYLTDKEFIFIEKSKMTRSTSFMYPSFHSKSAVVKSISVLFYPVFTGVQISKVRKQDGIPYFSFKSSKKTDPKTNNFKGKIYVLINGDSFSASCIISTNLDANNRATFVGNETGGAYNGTVAGLFALIELPNSKVKMNVGLLTIKTPYTIEPDGFGIKPDVYISNTTLEKDEQLEWILNDIKKLNSN
jgi:C-terminal processing protease CtpA/Prc